MIKPPRRTYLAGVALGKAIVEIANLLYLLPNRFHILKGLSDTLAPAVAEAEALYRAKYDKPKKKSAA